MTARALLILALAAPATALPAPGAPVTGSPHVTARLVAEADGIVPGRPAWIGLHLTMAPGWHTYWKNPGDSGLATKVRWTMPAGVREPELQWPYPERIEAGSLVSYGYHGELLLLAKLDAPAAVKAGDTLPIRAQASWLECEEACVPGKATLALELPVHAQPRRDPAWGDAFAKAAARLPRSLPGWQARLSRTEPTVVLELRPPSTVPDPRRLLFFPDRPRLVDDSTLPRVTRAAFGYRVELAPAANALQPYPGLTGVLVAEGWGTDGGTLPLALEARP